MQKLTIGIFAHVDAGKTTFSEQLLYQTQSIRTLGRVDHKSAYMDSHELERARGITIFSEQAYFSLGNQRYYLIDTPGHVDFSAEMARAIEAIDLAIVIVNGIDGLQSHTETILELFEVTAKPVIFFVNKLDAPHADFFSSLAALEATVPAVVDFTTSDALDFLEAIAERDEDILEGYELLQLSCEERLVKSKPSSAWGLADLMEYHQLGALLARAVQSRQIMPVFKGSALKGEGMDAFLEGLALLTEGFVLPGEEMATAPLAGLVYKVRYDEQGRRQTFIKLTSGQLKARDLLGQERITEIRQHQGRKSIAIEAAGPGDVVSVIGIKQLRIGDTLETEVQRHPRVLDGLSPALRSRMCFAPSTDVSGLFAALKLLEDEDPLLQVACSLETREITVSMMGAVQLEVLKALLAERFGYVVDFEAPQVIYRETLITPEVYGCGHFEPLRHYAEVHLTVEPLPLNSGIVFVDACHPEDLAVQHITQVRRCVTEMTHRGRLTGSALTDVRITLITGRGHLQHTATGDFAQATIRALRHAQEQAQMRLLEPVYAVRIRIPSSYVGRVMTDLTALNGQDVLAEGHGDWTIITGRVPIATFGDYAVTLASLTGGQGHLRLKSGGYTPCHNQEAVVASIGYDKDRDVAFPSASIFCSKGKGYTVPWQEALEHMHCPVGEKYASKQR